MGIFEDWRKGTPYEDLHRKYGPQCSKCGSKDVTWYIGGLGYCCDKCAPKDDEESNGCY